MMTKEKIKLFESIFTAALMVVLVGISVLAVSSNDTTPPHAKRTCLYFEGRCKSSCCRTFAVCYTFSCGDVYT